MNVLLYSNHCKHIISHIWLKLSHNLSHYHVKRHLLPTGSEVRGVLGVGSIPVAILPSRQVMKTIALHKHEYSLVIKIRNTSGSTEATIHPLAIILTAAV